MTWRLDSMGRAKRIQIQPILARWVFMECQDRTCRHGSWGSSPQVRHEKSPKRATRFFGNSFVFSFCACFLEIWHVQAAAKQEAGGIGVCAVIETTPSIHLTSRAWRTRRDFAE